ncbi:acid sugar phosphatase-like [Dermatophagoides farinae]|uniref:acid sugar phosphatase-like n=1 Tax=Dermatophagoides farinae TaxID=6954 RepID=UPI003F63718E
MNVYKAVLLDLDGVVWTRYGAIDKSPDATHLFKENGIKVFYLTNNSHRSQQETFDKLCKIYLTNQDVFYPAGNEIMPGTGSYLSCITMPHEILNDKIVVCGKPNVLISEHLKKMFALEKTEVVMVGDNLETDVKLGINCGYRSVLVETGVHSRADVEKLKIKPSKIFKSLYDMACNVNNEREQVNY